MSDADRSNTTSSPFGSSDPDDVDVAFPELDSSDEPDADQEVLFPLEANPFQGSADGPARVAEEPDSEWRPPYTQPDALWGDDALVAPAPEASDTIADLGEAAAAPEPGDLVAPTTELPQAMLPAGPGLAGALPPGADVAAEADAVPSGEEPTAPVADETPSEDGPAEAKRPLSFWRWLLEMVVVIAVGIVLALGIKQFLVQPFEIPSTSMLPTLEIGDRVLVDKMSYVWGRPVPGDIVVLTSPEKQGEDLIKRVVAVGGQEIDIRDGVVFVDGLRITEDYVEQGPVDDFSLDGTLTVPPGSVFLMGDNRTNSRDSRVFGPQPVDHLLGRAFMIYWPTGRFGGL